MTCALGSVLSYAGDRYSRYLGLQLRAHQATSSPDTLTHAGLRGKPLRPVCRLLCHEVGGLTPMWIARCRVPVAARALSAASGAGVASGWAQARALGAHANGDALSSMRLASSGGHPNLQVLVIDSPAILTSLGSLWHRQAQCIQLSNVHSSQCLK